MKESIKDLKHPLPTDPDEVADYLSEAVAKSAGAIKRDGRSWQYDLADGTLVENSDDGTTVFRFTNVGGRFPEEGLLGELITEAGGFSAKVVYTDGNHVFVSIADALEAMAEATLEVDPAGALTDLSTRLEAASREYYEPESPLAGLFDSERLAPAYASLEPDAKTAYLWLPPGADRTVESADLVYGWTTRGAKVLVCCRNGMETDALLTACIDLAGTENTSGASGRYLRVGWSPPDSGIRELLVSDYKAGLEESFQKESGETARLLNSLETEKSDLEKGIEERKRCDELAARAGEMETRSNRLMEELKEAESLLIELEAEWRGLLDQVGHLESAWLFRKKRRQAVLPAYRRVSKDCHDARVHLRGLKEDLNRLEEDRRKTRKDWNTKADACRVLPSIQEMEARLSEIISQIQQCHEKLKKSGPGQKNSNENFESEVIRNASVLFSPLHEIPALTSDTGLAFDRVLICGVDTAPASLTFLSAKLAKDGVVLAGDFVERAPSGPWVEAGREVMADILAMGCEASVRRNQKSSPPVQNKMTPAVAEVVRELAYRHTGLEFGDDPRLLGRPVPEWIAPHFNNPLVFVDTSEWGGWCGREISTLSRFNLRSAMALAQRAAKLAGLAKERHNGPNPAVFVVTPYAAQAELIAAFLRDFGAAGTACGTPESFAGRTAPVVLFDTVLEKPQVAARMISPAWPGRMSGELAATLSLAEFGIEMYGSASWTEANSHPKSALSSLFRQIRDKAETRNEPFPIGQGFRKVAGVPGEARELFGIFSDFEQPARNDWGTWVPQLLADGGEATLLIPDGADESGSDRRLTEFMGAFRENGGVVAFAKGMFGPELVIDRQSFLIGSGNGEAGFIEVKAPEAALKYLRLIQADIVRDRIAPNGELRLCPQCRGALVVVNQERQQGAWDRQAVKLACGNGGCGDYLRNIDERPPYKESPVCRENGRVRYKRIRRGRTEVWECPDHPTECPREPVVPGDPD